MPPAPPPITIRSYSAFMPIRIPLPATTAGRRTRRPRSSCRSTRRPQTCERSHRLGARGTACVSGAGAGEPFRVELGPTEATGTPDSGASNQRNARREPHVRRRGHPGEDVGARSGEICATSLLIALAVSDRGARAKLLAPIGSSRRPPRANSRPATEGRGWLFRLRVARGRVQAPSTCTARPLRSRAT